MKKHILAVVLCIVLVFCVCCPASLAASTCKATINSSKAKVYKSPSASATSLSAPKGVTVTVTAYKSGWAKISYKGNTGYMQSKYLTLNSGAKTTSKSSSKIDKAVNLALEQLGKPYGNGSPRSFNCSSLVRYVYGKQGYSIKRTAAKIARDDSLKLITSTSSLKKGDILCFDTNNDGECDHVGIYLGNSTFIEASQSKGVVQTNKLDNWYKKHMLCARRV